jgi:hypothetical protein
MKVSKHMPIQEGLLKGDEDGSETVQKTLDWLHRHAPKGRTLYIVHREAYCTPQHAYVLIYIPGVTFIGGKAGILRDITSKLSALSGYRYDRVGSFYTMEMPVGLYFEELVSEIGRCIWQDAAAYQYRVF